MSIAQVQKLRLFIDPIADYGAKFDHRVVFDGATTGATGIITSSTAAFVAGDVGKRIVLTGAGTGSGVNAAMYVGTITSLNSGTSANVTPNTTNTVSAKGLQIHTDDLTAWTNLVTDINASVFPGAVIKIPGAMVPTLTSGEAWQSSFFTGRSGVSGIIPTINKPVSIVGSGGGNMTDAGDYTKIGGSCIAFCGATWPSGFGAFLTIVPTIGSTSQALGGFRLQSFWLDCRNGDGVQALKAISLQSCREFVVDDVFIMDPGAVALELGVVDPGVAGLGGAALGDAKDCTRGHISNFRVRILENPAAGAVTTPFLCGSTVTLSTTPQSLSVAANTLPTVGYVWIMTNAGYPVLVQYTGGGGSPTLTGCVISATDNIDTPAISTASNIVQAVAQNGCSIFLSGDTGANTCLNEFNTIIIEQGSVFGPAAIEFRNSDSNEFHNLVINGGSAAATNATNRLTKPGVRFNGSNFANTMASRNNVLYGGSPGAGGCSVMALTNAGVLLVGAASANYWDDQQVANGEPRPNIEALAISATQGGAGGGFGFSVNGSLAPGAHSAGSTATAAQSIAAATTAMVAGSLLAIPPQGFQIGTTIRWSVYLTKTAAGTAARSHLVKIGTTGTTTDATVATMALTPTATLSGGKLEIIFTVVGPLGGTCAGLAMITTTDTTLGAAGGVIATMATWNSATPQQFISLTITTGASEVLTINNVTTEVVRP